MVNNIKKIDHIGIAVKNIDDHIHFYQQTLGLEFLGYKTVESQKIKTAMFQIGAETIIELLEPISTDSTIANFLEKRGEGLHHICYGVESVEHALKVAKNDGIRLIHEIPFIGAKGKKVAFLHPKSTGNVLTEFSE